VTSLSVRVTITKHISTYLRALRISCNASGFLPRQYSVLLTTKVYHRYPRVLQHLASTTSWFSKASFPSCCWLHSPSPLRLPPMPWTTVGSMAQGVVSWGLSSFFSTLLSLVSICLTHCFRRTTLIPHLVEVLKSNRTPAQKLIWCLVVFLFPVLGLIVYYLFSNRDAHRRDAGYEALA
jgi:hypothetical protein